MQNGVILEVLDKTSAVELIILSILTVAYAIVKITFAYKNNKLKQKEQTEYYDNLIRTKEYRDKLEEYIKNINIKINTVLKGYDGNVSSNQAKGVIQAALSSSKKTFILNVIKNINTETEVDKQQKDKKITYLTQAINVKYNRDISLLEMYKYKQHKLSTFIEKEIYNNVITISIQTAIGNSMTVNEFKAEIQLLFENTLNDIINKLNNLNQEEN